MLGDISDHFDGHKYLEILDNHRLFVLSLLHILLDNMNTLNPNF